MHVRFQFVSCLDIKYVWSLLRMECGNVKKYVVVFVCFVGLGNIGNIYMYICCEVVAKLLVVVCMEEEHLMFLFGCYI